MTQIGIIDAADFVKLMKDLPNLNILDIRTDLEVNALNFIQETSHHALHTITPSEFPKSDNKTYILCKMGPRAMALAEQLTEHGHKNLIVVDGGIMGCMQAGAPMQKADAQPEPQEIMAAVQESFRKFRMDNA